MTLAPAPDTAAIVAADASVSALTRWDSLAIKIAEVTEESEAKDFNYRDRYDNKAARSWVARLRRLKGDIERARKDAKAVHLERGRAVDATAKTLEEAVEGLITPHQLAIDAIDAEDQARIDGHRAVLARIDALAQGITTSTQAAERLAELATIDTLVLEEFATAGANRLAEAIETVEALQVTLQQQEAAAAELEALRAEKAARDEAERLERVRREAIEQERQRAAAQAIEQEAQIRREAEERQRASEEHARIEREAAAAREAEALAAADAARRAHEDAERRAAEAEQRAAEAAAREHQRQQEAAARAAAEAALAAESQRQQELMAAEFHAQIQAAIQSILDGADGLVPPAADIADAITSGTLHPAITIDWSRVG